MHHERLEHQDGMYKHLVKDSKNNIFYNEEKHLYHYFLHELKLNYFTQTLLSSNNVL